ncbi:esterase-like activity of phytase family protein [Streptomyces halobius]|uniref:Esterase-like activity of phytase family protein n=2 Tax=Streptomyces halobius TaxID=2879846 RepID=A0ABY4MDN6_9ACTN|nr:esterase-like activity of phytase family protein [Streptomyces halobius]UQA94471.1 esterase-like activity of phytase family protein [Streptomyces halobius]
MRARRMLATTATVIATTMLTAKVTNAAQGSPSAENNGRACSPYVSVAGFSDALDKTTFQGRYVGNLSALAAAPDGRVAALSGRSELFTLDPRRRPERVVSLADEKGGKLDSEGLVVDHDGSYLVTAETEPSIRRYDREGKLLGSLPVPEELRVAPIGKARLNQTFEGLALQPDGRTLIASMEGPLDGDPMDGEGRQLVRFQTWHRPNTTADFQPSGQYTYPVDKSLGISEITATGLVLERGLTEDAGLTDRLYYADLTHASGGRVVSKALFADLSACPSLGARHPTRLPNPLLDNIEGMLVTGREEDGRLKALMVSDDNQSDRQVTRLYEFSTRTPEAD